VGILEVLPARHPRNLGVTDVVGKARLPQQLRQITFRRLAVHVIAEVRPSWPLEFATPSGQMRDFEFSMMRADSRHDAATTTTRERTSTSWPVVRSM
jgi:hypothetical protein